MWREAPERRTGSTGSRVDVGLSPALAMRRGAARNPNSSAVYSTYSPSRSPVQMHLETSSSLTGRMAECVSQVCSHHLPILHEVGVLRRPALCCATLMNQPLLAESLLAASRTSTTLGKTCLSGTLAREFPPLLNMSNIWHGPWRVHRPWPSGWRPSCSLCPCRSVRTASASPWWLQNPFAHSGSVLLRPLHSGHRSRHSSGCPAASPAAALRPIGCLLHPVQEICRRWACWRSALRVFGRFDPGRRKIGVETGVELKLLFDHDILKVSGLEHLLQCLDPGLPDLCPCSLRPHRSLQSSAPRENPSQSGSRPF